MRTDTQGMLLMAATLLTRVETVFKENGFRWNPETLIEKGDITVSLGDGTTWSPNRGLILIREVAPEHLLQLLLRNQVYPTVV